MGVKEQRYGLAIALCLIAFAVCLRLLPHPANVAPVAAVAIFGGAILPRRLAAWLPVVVMALSDAFIGFYDYRIMLVVWGGYFAIALASSRWLRQPTWKAGVLLTISGSTFFFLVSNAAVWEWGGMYAHSAVGLIRCYIMALPFFRNTLVGDLFYTALLFGIYTYAVRAGAKKALEPGARI
jgi:hypothetical protein